METSGFRDLVRKAQAGSSPAVEQLFQIALPYIKRVVRDSAPPVRPGESLSDRVQNVCQRVLEKLDQFRGAREAADDEQTWAMFCGWVRQVVHTVERNAERGQGGPKSPRRAVSLQGSGPEDSTHPGGTIDPPADDSTASANLRAAERQRLVLEALERLPDPTHREIVRLRFFEELSLRQIAERLQLTYDVVRERFRVAMNRLERELEGLQEGN